MDEGKVKVARLVAIFVLGGLLLLNLLVGAIRSSIRIDLTVALTFLLVLCLVKVLWHPTWSMSSIEEDDRDGFPPVETDTPLVTNEAPPSYDEVVSRGRNSIISMAGSEDLPHAPRSHTGEASTHVTPNEIMLSVDGLPSYEAAISATYTHGLAIPPPPQDQPVVFI